MHGHPLASQALRQVGLPLTNLVFRQSEPRGNGPSNRTKQRRNLKATHDVVPLMKLRALQLCCCDVILRSEVPATF